jgi:hypothetical protein
MIQGSFSVHPIDKMLIPGDQNKHLPSTVLPATECSNIMDDSPTQTLLIVERVAQSRRSRTPKAIIC